MLLAIDCTEFLAENESIHRNFVRLPSKRDILFTRLRKPSFIKNSLSFVLVFNRKLYFSFDGCNWRSFRYITISLFYILSLRFQF